MRKFMIFMMIAIFLLAACGGSDDDTQDKTNNDDASNTNTEETTSNDADLAEGGQFVLNMTGEVDHLNGEGELLNTIVIDSEIPVTGRLVYEGQTRNDEPRYTLYLEAYNTEFPDTTQVHLETDDQPNGLIFSNLKLGLHQPIAGTTFTFPDDLTGDSYGEMVELDYALWTATDWQASFNNFAASGLTGTVSITQLDTVATGSFDLIVKVRHDDNPDTAIGEIHLSAEFNDIALENPDDMP